jgi:hypothetical protein
MCLFWLDPGHLGLGLLKTEARVSLFVSPLCMAACVLLATDTWFVKQ